MNAQQIDREEEEYEEYLRDMYGDVSICGISCDAVDALKVVDETSFNVGYADWSSENRAWECAKCDETYNDEEEAQVCCEDISNDGLDDLFREAQGIEGDDDTDHNDLNATMRMAYNDMTDSYQKDGLISERQAENFTYNGNWD